MILVSGYEEHLLTSNAYRRRVPTACSILNIVLKHMTFLSLVVVVIFENDDLPGYLFHLV